jgi:steroid Delta-isomerase
MSDALAPTVQRLVAAYEALRPDTLDALMALYAPDAHFVDPYNDVQGRERIRAVFAHMFATAHQPRFRVLSTTTQGSTTFIVWDFSFGQPKPGRLEPAWKVHGCSRLTWVGDAATATVSDHRDYWDPATEIYQHLPVLGVFFRWLRRRLGTPVH